MPNPSEKPYQPSPEEIKKAEEMMTEEQKEKSEERKGAYEAGGKFKEHEIIMNTPIDEIEWKRRLKEFATNQHISKDIENLLLDFQFRTYRDTESRVRETSWGKYEGWVDKICPAEKVTEEQILRVIEEFPSIRLYDARLNPKIFTRRVIEKLLEKFPDVEINFPEDNPEIVKNLFEIGGNRYDYLSDVIKRDR